MNERKNNIESINNRLDEAEERAWKLKDRLYEIIQLEEQKEKRMKGWRQFMGLMGHHQA